MPSLRTSSLSRLMFHDLLDAMMEDAAEGPLCVPNDPVEELDWYPNFTDCSLRIEDFSQVRNGISSPPCKHAPRKPRRTRCGKRVWSTKPPVLRLNPSQEDGGDDELCFTPRVCKHCMAEETPQWRAGPEGPGTLCNACGIRYKSGRLFPEYRPAASPMFLGDDHSNSHKEVMKMRKAKDMQVE